MRLQEAKEALEIEKQCTAVKLRGAIERALMVLEAKNHWADRARRAEQALRQVGKDKVVDAVCIDLQQRSEVGLKKYGVSLERKDLILEQWLQHAYEETLDTANYLKRSIMEIRGEL